jgi:uncharacterized protein (DUF302 family)
VLEDPNLARGREVYARTSLFWTKIFSIAFGLGVVTGIVMPFKFGRNWSCFSTATANVSGTRSGSAGASRMIVMAQEAGLPMRGKIFALTAVMCLWGVQAMAADGLTTMRSSYGPKDTMNRLEAEVKAKGMTVFARIDHAAGAAGVGLSLRPTEVLLFGNAKAGTPLMQLVQTIGIDLPLKVLVWQDASGGTWLSYNDPSWLARRHGLGHEVNAAVSAMTAALDVVARAATEVR